MIIDTWVLPNTPEVARGWPPHLAHVFRMFKRDEALSGTTPDQVVTEMDAAGVDVAIVTALVEDDFVIGNELVAEWVAAHPSRFQGRACVDPRKPLAAVRELERCVTELGFRSLQVLPYAFGKPFDDRMYYPLFTKCCELGIPVVTQVGHVASLLRSDPGRPIYIDDVALDFPELTIVGGHIGWPWTDEMIALAWKHPNVYIDSSAHAPRRFEPQFLRYLKGPGRDKCLFGTDYPLLTFERCISDIRALELEDEVERKFLGENAMRVYGISREDAR